MAKTQKKTVGYFRVTAHKDNTGKFHRGIWVELPDGGTIQIWGNGERCEVTSYGVGAIDFRHAPGTPATLRPF